MVDQQGMILKLPGFLTELAANPGHFPFVNPANSHGSSSIDQLLVGAQRVAVNRVPRPRKFRWQRDKPNPVADTQFSPRLFQIITVSNNSQTIGFNGE
jgi:hypothetical protein